MPWTDSPGRQTATGEWRGKEREKEGMGGRRRRRGKGRRKVEEGLAGVNCNMQLHLISLQDHTDVTLDHDS